MNQRIWWLEDIFVEENERGKGIGRKLISKMAKKGFHFSLSSATAPMGAPSNNQRRLMTCNFQIMNEIGSNETPLRFANPMVLKQLA